MKTVDASFLPNLSYKKALNFMKQLANQTENGKNEAILLCEHTPVITLGRRASVENLLFSEDEYAKKGVELYNINRGGDVTFHGPGQLVGYPVFKVGRKVREHVDNIFQVLSDMLMLSGIKSFFDAENPGLWVENQKIAAVGIEVKKGISIHGFSLNVSPKFDGFSMIIPCGITDKGVIYWSELDNPPDLNQIALVFAKRLANRTNKKLNWLTPKNFIELRNLQ